MSLGDQTKLKIARKEETLNGRWSNLTHISRLSLGHKTKIGNCLKEDNIKILKVDYLSNHLFDLTEILNLSFIKPWLIFHRGNSKENLGEISSVALLSPACFWYLFLISLGSLFYKSIRLFSMVNHLWTTKTELVFNFIHINK